MERKIIIMMMVVALATSCTDLSYGYVDDPIMMQTIERWERDHYHSDEPIKGFVLNTFCQDWEFSKGWAQFDHGGEMREMEVNTNIVGITFEKDGDLTMVFDTGDSQSVHRGRWMIKGNLLVYAYKESGSLWYYAIEIVSVTKTTLTLRDPGTVPDSYTLFEYVRK